MGGDGGLLELDLQGITCSGCVEDMEKLLLETEGILEATVQYATGAVRVRYDPARIARGQVVAKVRGFGFPLRD